VLVKELQALGIKVTLGATGAGDAFGGNGNGNGAGFGTGGEG